MNLSDVAIHPDSVREWAEILRVACERKGFALSSLDEGELIHPMPDGRLRLTRMREGEVMAELLIPPDCWVLCGQAQ